YPICGLAILQHIVVEGQDFRGFPAKRKTGGRVRCPRFETSAAIAPSDVRRLILWCLHTATANRLTSLRKAETRSRRQTGWRARIRSFGMGVPEAGLVT